MIGVDGPVRAALEDGGDEARERTLGTTLHKDPGPVRIHALDLSDPLDRAGDLLGEDVDHLISAVRPCRVVATRHIGGDRTPRRLDVEPGEHSPERHRGRSDNLRVKGMAHRQWIDRDIPRPKRLDRRLDGPRSTRDDRLARAVLVGWDHIARDLREHGLDLLHAGRDSSHLAAVVDLNRSHLPAPSADRDERIPK